MIRKKSDFLQPGERIVGPRIYLRLLVPEDCKSPYVEWLNDPEVNRYLETRWNLQTRETIEDFVGKMLADNDSYLFAIIDKETDTHIGNIKIGPIHPHYNYADISSFIGEKKYWGKGYVTEAKKIVVYFAFEILKLRRLQAATFRSNKGSVHSSEKAGFVLEGELRSQIKSFKGWEDHLYFGLLREEWKQDISIVIKK